MAAGHQLALRAKAMPRILLLPLDLRQAGPQRPERLQQLHRQRPTALVQAAQLPRRLQEHQEDAQQPAAGAELRDPRCLREVPLHHLRHLKGLKELLARHLPRQPRGQRCAHAAQQRCGGAGLGLEGTHVAHLYPLERTSSLLSGAAGFQSPLLAAKDFLFLFYFDPLKKVGRKQSSESEAYKT